MGLKRTAMAGALLAAVLGLTPIALGQQAGGAAQEAGATAPADPAGNQSGPADDEIAKSLFAAGKGAYAAGNYEEALRHFQEAYQHSKRPELLYNVGVAADRLRYNRTALEAFKSYMRELPTAENRSEVDNRIRALQAVVDREQATSVRLPTPATAARSGSSVDASLSSTAPRHQDPALVSQWWFWTAAGGVLAAVIVGVVIATSGDKTGKATPGSDGVVVLTLSRQ